VSDAKAFEHYDDPAKREPAPGVPRRRADRPLTQHVPVRFPAETIEHVRRLAEADGMTVSAWIRRAVERTLRQQDATGVGRAEAGDDARTVVERLQRDVADLAAALERSSQLR
jgi:predicted DNA-binding protein